ncbi:MAG: benzoate-CoA ligase family protein [Bradyrhizobium sp.]
MSPESLEIADHVPSDSAGAREIGFSIPATYNASRILFDNLDKGRGGRLALTGPLGTRSYAQLCAEASKWGHGFLSLGLKRGDRVLMFLDDTPAYPAAFFGAVRAGFVPLLINTLTPPDLLQFYLSDSAATVAVADAEFGARFDAVACKDTQLRTLIMVNGEASDHKRDASDHKGDASDHAVPNTVIAGPWLADFPADLAEADTNRNEMAFWMYSSGSTGRPKGIVHLQHDMAYSDLAFAQNILKLRPDDICFSVPKMFFAYGFGNSITFPFAAGAATLLLPGQPKPQAIFAAIERFRPSVFFGLPTLYTSLTKAEGAGDTDFSSLRMALSAAEVLSADVFNGWKTLTGLEIVEGLGSTEVLHIYLSNHPENKKLGAAGLRVPGYEIALRDSNGSDVGDNEEGILWVRGDSNTPLYWNRPDKSAETIRAGGWIYTGDRFVRDSDGFHFFRGRADDLIKISGQWVYPLEVELCLAEHPQVRECAVFATELPDRRMTLKAVVVMNSRAFDESEMTKMLQDFVKAKLLPYKYPRQVKFLDELPKTGTGKIDRQALLRA